MNRIGFVVTTSIINRVIAYEYARDDFKRKLEDVFRHALGRNLIIESMTQKGFVEKRDNARSMLATGRAVIAGSEGSLYLSIATMTTFVLDQKRLVTVVQIGRINSDADLPAFTGQALDRVSQILPSSAGTGSR